MQQTVKCVVIDPIDRSIKEAQIKVKRDEEFGFMYPDYEHLVELTGASHYVEHMSLGSGVAGYLDEEGLLIDWDDQAFFRLSDSPPFAGRMVLVYERNGGIEDVPQQIITMTHSFVKWVDPKDVRVKAPRMTDDDGNVTLLAGVDEWTYENQPA